MCEPVSIISGVVGAAGAVAGHAQQQNATNAANASSIANYKQQLRVRENNWMRALSQWENDKINYGEEIADNSFAAQQGYADAQLQLNEQFNQAAFAQEGDLIKLLEGQGEMAAAGRTGKSAGRVDTAMLAAFGRNNAQRTASLVSSKEGYRQSVEEIQRQTRDANETAFDNVAFAPQADMAPRAPKMKEGPSGLNLALGLAGAGLSAYGTYKAGKAPKGFIDPPNYNTLKAPTGIGNNIPFGGAGWKPRINSAEWAPTYRGLDY